MESQHKITISGVVFHVEDCCKKQLMKHLSEIRNITTTTTLTEEVAAILLEELKSEKKDVVGIPEVQHLIKRTRHLK